MTNLTDKKEPTYYVSLTDYNEVKRMFLKANNDINKLKDLLKECQKSIHWYQETYGAMDLDTYTLIAKLKEVLK